MFQFSWRRWRLGPRNRRHRPSPPPPPPAEDLLLVDPNDPMLLDTNDPARAE